MTTTLPTLRAEEVARRWLEVDPDPGTRAETEQLLTDGGAALERRFGSRLAFGTAGLRGPLGAGPMRMNRVLVRMTAAAIGRRLQVKRFASRLLARATISHSLLSTKVAAFQQTSMPGYLNHSFPRKKRRRIRVWVSGCLSPTAWYRLWAAS